MGGNAAASNDSVLALSLRDGTEIFVQESLPGFDPFLDAAETTLSGLSRKGSWLAGMENSEIVERDTVLFERYPPRV